MCKEEGDKALRSMVGKMRTTTHFEGKTQAVTLACKTAVGLTEGNVQVDPQLLFQRLSFLVSLRYSRFCQKITTGSSFVQPECLPLTSAAAGYHSLRVHHQVQQWIGVTFPPQDWGWKLVDGKS